MTISRRTRFEILRRDANTCRYCGASAPDVKLTVDHVIPEALGGGDEPNNLVTACQDCNAGKASIAPDQAMVDDVDATALLFAKAMERATEIRKAEIGALDGVLGSFERPYDWAHSVTRFLEAGLTQDDLDRLLAIAMTSRATPSGLWRYFCGCCWREITDRQELARRLIEDGEV